MGDNFKIFSQKWNYDKMMSWNKPLEHTGTNCGELLPLILDWTKL